MNRLKKDLQKRAFKIAEPAVKAQYAHGPNGQPNLFTTGEVIDCYATAYERGFKDAQAELRKELKNCSNGANDDFDVPLAAHLALNFIKPFR